MCVIILYTNV